MFSPHTWRCFRPRFWDLRWRRVFSTYVEVFLTWTFSRPTKTSFLHIRGGVSIRGRRSLPLASFSPHTWRCFSLGYTLANSGTVFSTYVEVFPPARFFWLLVLCFLHISGGVSIANNAFRISCLFSPHTWRCFRSDRVESIRLSVFSTYVEVFPQRIRTALTACCFLHIRGGVSDPSNAEKLIELFSPRMWRCFQALLQLMALVMVFSTYVEVFLELPF